MQKTITNVHQLIGEEISTVAFVRDYIELHFDGPILRCLTNPSISSPTINIRFPEPGSRDALCGTIGFTIRALTLDEERALELVTSNEYRITVPLDSASRRGPEAMHFVPDVNKPVQIW